jgi:hypothetical protein
MLYTANGDRVGDVDFESLPADPRVHGYFLTTELPKSGSYRLVMQPYGPSADMTLTLWDLAQAPKPIRDSAQSNGNNNCVSSGGFFGGTECFSQGTSTTFGVPTSGSGSQNASATSTPVTATTSPTTGP